MKKVVKNNKPRARVMEYDRWSGPEELEVYEFDTEKERDDFINKYNKRNTSKEVPDYYTVVQKV